MMWGQPPPTYNTADPWYDGAANYDYGAGQEVEQRCWVPLTIRIPQVSPCGW